jgi:hypothetical protein
MNNLTPVFERETGQVILEGPPAGAAGEAPLVPVPDLELAFDRADGRLCRAVLEAAGADGPIAVGEQVAAMLIRLFGSQAPSVISGAAAWPGEGPGGGLAEGPGRQAPGTRALSPEPGLTAVLSSLARLDAARATSPVPPGSPWWAAEAAELAQRAGLDARARTEAHQALAQLLGQPDSLRTLPEQAVCAALAVASISGATEPDAAGRLREAVEAAIQQAWPANPGPGVSPPGPAFDVAAEVQSLEKDRTRLTGLQWMLDPGLVPEGLFRPGLSPYSDLTVRHEAAPERVIVEAMLAPGADRGALGRCVARLVDPSVRRVLAQAAFTTAEPDAPSRVRAELRLKFPLDEVQDSWIEVVKNKYQPVRSTKGHRIKRALRWADAALRAERAPAGLARPAACEDWADLAAVAWEQCWRDWVAAADTRRADLAAQRQAALDSQPCASQPPPGGPACLAEVLGR